MMVKVFNPADYGFAESITSLVKVADRGLRGYDLNQFVKRAAADFMVDLRPALEKVAKDETLIHMLIVGATEKFGANRNGDGFPESVCRNYHRTFEKYAKFYRDHKNKPFHPHYGRIVKSAYNEPMSRIELLVALFNNKEAASRHQGGMPADKELERLHKGLEVPTSMSCLVPSDFCSYCNNEAPDPKAYCKGINQGGRCKAGGLKDNMGALVEMDGGIHHLHAKNLLPRFFDASHVDHQADRAAYVTGIIEKCAAAGGKVLKSAELAQQLGIAIPYEIMVENHYRPHVQRLLKTACRLAEIERDVEASPNNFPLAAAVTPSAQSVESGLDLPYGFREKFAVSLAALAEAGICLPLHHFIEVVAKQNIKTAHETAAVVSRELPGIYTRLLADPDLPERIANSGYAPATCAAPAALQAWTAKHAAALSLREGFVRRRMFEAALAERTPVMKTASATPNAAITNEPAAKLAAEYALYKLAFLDQTPETAPDFPLTASLVILQNYAG